MPSAEECIDARNQVREWAIDALVKINARIKVTPQIEFTEKSDSITVSVKLPFSQVAYFPPFLYAGDIEGNCTFHVRP